MRLISVSLWELNDGELDDLAAAADATEPARAASFRRFKIWRRTHPDRPRLAERHKRFLVLRSPNRVVW